MNNRFYNLKYIIILSGFFILLFSLGAYLFSINNNIQKYSTKVRQINQLLLLNKDFNHFAIQKSGFLNYDIINQKIKKFEIIIDKLNNQIIQENQNILLLKYIKEIKNIYQQKILLLEHIKSYNSTASSSIEYLHDLKKNMDNYSSLSKEQLAVINDTLFMTLELYTNIFNDGNQLHNNLKKIKSLIEDTDNNYIKYFYNNTISNIDQILSIQKEYKNIRKLKITHKLEKIHQILQSQYLKYQQTSHFILTVLMFSIFAMIVSIYILFKKSLEAKIKLQAYKYAIENSDNSIVITDLQHNITYVNDAFEKETLYKKEEVLGKNPNILKSGMMPDSHYENLLQTLQNRQKWEGEFINTRKDGTLMYEKASINPIIINGEITSYIAIKLNITKYVEQEKKVKFLALHDPLTSLPNRLNFQQYFKNHIQKHKHTAALMYLDLDRFKTINDSLGHHVGDELLKVFAKRLQFALNKDDFIARIGGDEFVIIIKIKEPKEAKIVAKRILDLLQTPIFVQKHNLNITTSIGIAYYPNDGDTLDILTKHADTAMYHAKQKGRNNFQLFSKTLSKEIDEKLQIDQALREAIKNNELYMMYQPKYSLKSKEIIGFEALVRWENPTLGFVGPDKFIPIAEDIGMIDAIGLFVFKKACQDFKLLKSINPNLKTMAINVSVMQLNNKNFIKKINKISQKEQINRSQIELEITESKLMDNVQRHITLLQKLKAQGYKIAIDDFGTGYSSFGYLNKLPIDTIKIDKSFIDDITLKKSDKDIVKAIITLCQNLNFHTVAEGIETKEQEEMLKSFGCDIGQGYLFSRAQKMQILQKFIKENMLEDAFA